MGIAEMKEQYYLQKGHLFKSLSSPVRLQLFNYISFCPRTVEDCAIKTNQSIQNTSLHLANLFKAGILEVEKIKNFRFYSIANSEMASQTRKLLRSLNETLLPQDLVFNEPLIELVSILNKKETSLIDLRSPEEKAFIPLGAEFSFEGNLSHLPHFLKDNFAKQSSLVLICRGAMCERLTEAVLTAKKTLYKVRGVTFDAENLSEFAGLLRN